jgi:Ca2+-dependent lipid-binding protein
MKLNSYNYIRCKTMTVCLILFLFSLYDLLCISDLELCKMSSKVSTENNKFDSYMCDGSSKTISLPSYKYVLPF